MTDGRWWRWWAEWPAHADRGHWGGRDVPRARALPAARAALPMPTLAAEGAGGGWGLPGAIGDARSSSVAARPRCLVHGACCCNWTRVAGKGMPCVGERLLWGSGGRRVCACVPCLGGVGGGVCWGCVPCCGDGVGGASCGRMADLVGGGQPRTASCCAVGLGRECRWWMVAELYSWFGVASKPRASAGSQPWSQPLPG